MQGRTLTLGSILLVGFLTAACGSGEDGGASNGGQGGAVGGATFGDGGGGWPTGDASSTGGQGGTGSIVCNQEGAQQTCASAPPGLRGIGECQDGNQTCSGGFWGPCVGDVGPSEDVCDQKDNDCDGLTDEDCQCTSGATQSCYTGPKGSEGVGECRAGKQSCDSGQWSASCQGQQSPSNETCNGDDDDCDGKTDEDNPGGGSSCSTGLPGPCATGKRTCKNGKLECESSVSSSDPKCQPCAGCLGSHKNCDVACQKLVGSPGGSCSHPTSTDFSKCCTCQPKRNCAGCLGSQPDCNAACKGIGSSGGYCAYDGSTVTNQCCACF